MKRNVTKPLYARWPWPVATNSTRVINFCDDKQTLQMGRGCGTNLIFANNVHLNFMKRQGRKVIGNLEVWGSAAVVVS